MAVKPLRCPHCGGVIETFDETMKKGFCPFCDTLIEDVQERQGAMEQIPIVAKIGENQVVTSGKKKRSGIIRFIIAIIALIIIVIHFVHESTLGGNGEAIGGSNLYVLLCIGVLIGTVIGLIIDLIRRKEKSINIIFSICAVIISAIAFVSIYPLGSWSYSKYLERHDAYWESNNSSGNNTMTAENELKPEEAAAIKAVEALKSVLKNPESMQVHSVFYCNESLMESVNAMFANYPDHYGTRYGNIEDYIDCTYLFKIDLSAQNGFGGMNRETYYISYQSGFVSTQQLGEDYQNSFKRLSDEFNNLCVLNIDISKLKV